LHALKTPSQPRFGEARVTTVDYAVVVGFLLALAYAGLWISRLIKDSDDFFVAGRELTPFILCATITATNLSMLHFIGMGGTAYNYCLWLLAFSLVSVLYSVIGGAWAVAIMDSVQFLIMLAGALVILPVAARAAGGAGGMHAVFQNLRETGRENHLNLIPHHG